MRVLIAQLNPTIGDFFGNERKISQALKHAQESSCELVIFSELVVCGYPPEDLLLAPNFIEACDAVIEHILPQTKGLTVLLGTPRRSTVEAEKWLHNSAAIIENGVLIGYQDKRLLPTYDVFAEKRYFEPGKSNQVWNLCNKRIGITICEDMWRPEDRLIGTRYACDPITDLMPQHPDLFINLSASPYSYAKLPLRLRALARGAKRLGCPALLCNQIGGNDSLIFDGNSLVTNAHGQLIARGKSFAEDYLIIDTENLGPPLHITDDVLADLYRALVCGLRDYFTKSTFKKACFGLSGGIDSTLVACLAVEALGAENLLGVLMPSRYSSEDSLSDAHAIADALGIATITVPIEEPFKAYEKLLNPFFGGKPSDITEENLQARIRGIILMALSNKHGYIVLSTGNKSEMAMGYATLYGDMCGGLSVINDVSKMQVYALCRWLKGQGVAIPDNVLTKPPSAELAPGQKDSDSLPSYEIVDTVLEEYIEHHATCEEIARRHHLPQALVDDLVNRIHRNEYKRRQAAPGLRVTEKAFSVGRCLPIVQKWH